MIQANILEKVKEDEKFEILRMKVFEKIIVEYHKEV